MTAREQILGDARRAVPVTAGGTSGTRPPSAPARGGPQAAAERTALFARRASEVGASVTRVSGALTDAIAAVLMRHQAHRVVVPADLPATWGLAGAATTADDGSLTAPQLDAFDAAVTGCALAVAQTGTVVLDAGAHQGRRALSLVPDLHVCVITARQIVDDVPAAVLAIADGARVHGRPVTLVTGPSATSDIELRRVEGVHGPRRLELLVVDDISSTAGPDGPLTTSAQEQP